MKDLICTLIFIIGILISISGFIRSNFTMWMIGIVVVVALLFSGYIIDRDK